MPLRTTRRGRIRGCDGRGCFAWRTPQSPGGSRSAAAAARRLVFTLAPRGECLYESRIGDSHPTGPLLRQFSLYSIANTFAHMLEPYGQFLPRVSCVGNIPRGCAPLGCSLHTPHSVGISPYVTRFAQVLLQSLIPKGNHSPFLFQ